MNVRKLGFTALAAFAVGVSAYAMVHFPDSPAFEVGTRVGQVGSGSGAGSGSTQAPSDPATEVPPSPLPFGFNPGDCPTEDSCEAPGLDYRDGRWHVEPAVRVVP